MLFYLKVEASSAFRGIGVVKLMGRQSGFIAMQASMASGTHFFPFKSPQTKPPWPPVPIFSLSNPPKQNLHGLRYPFFPFQIPPNKTSMASGTHFSPFKSPQTKPPWPPVPIFSLSNPPKQNLHGLRYPFFPFQIPPNKTSMASGTHFFPFKSPQTKATPTQLPHSATSATLLGQAVQNRLHAGVVDICLIPEVAFRLEGARGLFAYLEQVPTPILFRV